MKSIQKIYNFIKNEYSTYRSFVPNYASAALSFYFILMIVPALTLLAFFVSGLHLDYSILKDYLKEIVFPDYTDTIINLLESRVYSSIAIVTTLVSFWVVSRGISMIYQISNLMFHNKQDNLLYLLLHSFETVALILLLTVFIIIISVSGPFGELITILNSINKVRYFLMIIGLDVIFFMLYIIIARSRNMLIPAFIGANISTICFVCVHLFLSYYFKHANYTSVYGPFSAIIMVLFGIRIYAEVFYIGLYITYRIKNWRFINGEN